MGNQIIDLTIFNICTKCFGLSLASIEFPIVFVHFYRYSLCSRCSWDMKKPHAPLLSLDITVIWDYIMHFYSRLSGSH